MEATLLSSLLSSLAGTGTASLVAVIMFVVYRQTVTQNQVTISDLNKQHREDLKALTAQFREEMKGLIAEQQTEMRLRYEKLVERERLMTDVIKDNSVAMRTMVASTVAMQATIEQTANMASVMARLQEMERQQTKKPS